MRHTPYHQRFDRTYLYLGKGRGVQTPTNFRYDAVKIEDSFNGNGEYPRAKASYYRPFTTSKQHSMIEIKPIKQPKQDLYKKQLQIGRRKDNSFDHLKGKLYRGSLWRSENRSKRQLELIKSTRNSEIKRQQQKISKPIDLLGHQVKQSKEETEEYFQYIMRFSYRTKKGHMPSNPNKVNQDAYILNPNLNSQTWQHFFAVCDGHGPLGHLVSTFIKNTLPNSLNSLKTLHKYPREGLSKAFQNAYEKLLKQSNIDLNFSGSTVIGCYLQQNRLFCANVGDSRAILGRLTDKKWSSISLSVDHKPSLPKEAERIKKMKGRIDSYRDENGQPLGPLRVWIQNDNVPGLAMTRSFGDLVGVSVGVSPVPEIKQIKLTQEDRIIVIGSDGLFEFLQNEIIIKSLIPYYESKQIQQASEFLMNLASKSWMNNSSIIDDITFILIFVSYEQV